MANAGNQSGEQVANKAAGLMSQIEGLPASAYYWGAIGSIRG